VRKALQVFTLIVVVLYFVNAQYQFSGTGKNIETLSPISASFQSLGNSPLLKKIPIPLPEDMVLGIDFQRWEFEQKMWSFFCGEWRLGGWWNYYLVGMLLKIPIPFWIMFALGTAAVLSGAIHTNCEWRSVVALFGPPTVILVLISSQTGFNHHIRYAIPSYPFLFVTAAAGWDRLQLPKKVQKLVYGLLLIWYVTSSLVIYPHSLSYFSELIGGPANGHYFLGNSNVDWGQDIYLIELWKHDHPNKSIDGYSLSYPAHLAIPGGREAPLEPTPGRYVVSMLALHPQNPNKGHEYFLNYRPIARIGWSTYVYEIPVLMTER
jgi:hypothetical protein